MSSLEEGGWVNLWYHSSGCAPRAKTLVLDGSGERKINIRDSAEKTSFVDCQGVREGVCMYIRERESQSVRLTASEDKSGRVSTDGSCVDSLRHDNGRSCSADTGVKTIGKA